MEMMASRSRLGSRREGFTALEFTGVIAVIAVVLCLIVSWGSHVRERAREISCMSNLKQIGTAMHLYAADHGNHLPPGEDAVLVLAGVYVRNQQVFVCPCDENPTVIRTEGAEDQAQPAPDQRPPSGPFYGGSSPTEMECSYLIVPGLMTDDPPAELMAAETAARHEGRWNAIRLDGRLESRPESEWPVYWPSGSER